jgi:hypothetical protein
VKPNDAGQHRDCYEDQDGFPRHFMIRPLATTKGADIFALVKRGKEPRFPWEERPHLCPSPRESNASNRRVANVPSLVSADVDPYLFADVLGRPEIREAGAVVAVGLQD